MAVWGQDGGVGEHGDGFAREAVKGTRALIPQGWNVILHIPHLEFQLPV